jgi:hypothetical protein
LFRLGLFRRWGYRVLEWNLRNGHALVVTLPGLSACRLDTKCTRGVASGSMGVIANGARCSTTN